MFGCKFQSVCGLVAVPKCMRFSGSAEVYAVLLQYQSVFDFVAVPKCMPICCSTNVYAVGYSDFDVFLRYERGSWVYRCKK